MTSAFEDDKTKKRVPSLALQTSPSVALSPGADTVSAFNVSSTERAGSEQQTTASIFLVIVCPGVLGQVIILGHFRPRPLRSLTVLF